MSVSSFLFRGGGGGGNGGMVNKTLSAFCKNEEIFPKD